MMNNSSQYHNSTIITETSDLSQCALFVLLIPALIGNTTAILIFGRSLKQNVLTRVMFFLSCTDLLGCFYATFVTLQPLFSDLFSPELCHLFVFFGSFSGLLSALFAALLALDRYFALCKPYSYKTVFSEFRTSIYVIIVFTVAVFICLLNVIGLGASHRFVESPVGHRIICTAFFFQEQAHKRVFGFVYGLSGITILLVVIFCNLRVIVAVLKMRRHVQGVTRVNEQFQNGVSMKTELTFARVIFGLSIALLIFWGPFMMNSLLSQILITPDYPFALTSSAMVTLNFIIDPFVFVILKRSYRQEVATFLRRLCCPGTQRQVDQETPSRRSDSASGTKRLQEAPV